MGVQGLWEVIEPTGRPVNIHSLRGKVLAIDVSIWLHQSVKGFRDKDGNPLPNAHLLGVFFRVCKLLNYGVKPVFVFDGGVPVLKRQTMTMRKQRKLEAQDKSESCRQKLLSNFIRQQLQRQMKQALPSTMRMEAKLKSLSSPSKSKSPQKSASPSTKLVDPDLESFREKLAAKTADDGEKSDRNISCDSEDSEDFDRNDGMDYSENFSTILSSDFNTLPLETQHEILFQMQESKKMNSWGKLDQMPKDLQNFSAFQMDRLVKRRTLQKKIQTVQQEMGQRHIHVQNLDDLLKFDYDFDAEKSEVIASQEKGFVLVKSKQEIATSSKAGTSGKNVKKEPEVITIDDYVTGDWSSDSEAEIVKTEDRVQSEDEQLSLAIQLSLADSAQDIYNEDSQKNTVVQNNLSAIIESTADREVISDASVEPKLSGDNAAINGYNQKSNTKLDSQNQNNCNSKNPENCYNEITENREVSEQKAAGLEFVPSGESKASSYVTESDLNEKISENIFFSNLNHSRFESCAKFLDKVRYTEKVESRLPIGTNTEPAKAVHLDGAGEDEKPTDSDSCDDFEEVQMHNVPEVSTDGDTSLGKTTVNNLIQIFHTRENKAVVIEIDEKAIKQAPEDDMFAEVFADGYSNTTEETEGSEVRTSEKDSKEDDNLDIDWGSDPDTQSDLETAPEEIEKLKESSVTEESGNQSKEDGLIATRSNQKIVRTLGTMPIQREVKMISAEYMQAQQRLNMEHNKLQQARGFQERVATSITDQMYIEAQELLSLFGIPYIVSPMEAESQCAFLDTACLTEGTITDDSDVWLFGGQRVYKNFFAMGDKHVEFFQYADIVRKLNLDREKLVLMAILTGNDYSVGIQGVGPVSALEILGEFPSNSIIGFESLTKFQEWWELAQTTKDTIDAKNKLRGKFCKLKLRPGFPNKAVYDAFMEPTIDDSTENFKWGKPDLDSLRTFTRVKFGWEEAKCDSTLLPVLKNLRCQDQSSRQLTMDYFVTSRPEQMNNSSKRKPKSQRLGRAVKRLKLAAAPLSLNLSSESDSETDPTVTKSSPHKSTKRTKKLVNHKSIDKNVEVTPKESAKFEIESTNIKSNLPAIMKKAPVIPQKAVQEQERKMNKEKAIERFKTKNKK